MTFTFKFDERKEKDLEILNCAIQATACIGNGLRRENRLFRMVQMDPTIQDVVMPLFLCAMAWTTYSIIWGEMEPITAYGTRAYAGQE